MNLLSNIIKTKFYLRAILFLCLFYLISGCTPPQPLTNPSSSYSHYSVALNYFNAGMNEKALPEIDLAISLNPKIAKFYYLKARINERLGKPEEAVKAYYDVLALRSHDPVTLEALGNLYAGQGKYTYAIQTLRKAYNQKPGRNDLLLTIAEYQLKIDRYDQADNSIHLYKSLVKDSTKFEARYFCLLGMVSYYQQNYKKSAYNIEKCRSSMKIDSAAVKIILYSYFELGDFGKAYQLLTAPESKNLQIGDLYFFRGVYYFYTSNYKDAHTQLELALKFDTAEELVYVYLGKIYLKKENAQKAREMFETYRRKANKPVLESEIEQSLRIWDD